MKTQQALKDELKELLFELETPECTGTESARQLLADIAKQIPYETFFGKNFRICKDRISFNGRYSSIAVKCEVVLSKDSALVFKIDTTEAQVELRKRLEFVHKTLGSNIDNIQPLDWFSMRRVLYMCFDLS